MRRRRGTEAIEFALVFPIWVMVHFATIDITWLYMHLAAIDHAAQVGCRSGSLLDPGEHQEDLLYLFDATEDRMREVAAGLLGDACPGCQVSVSTVGDPPMRLLRCELSVAVQGPTGLLVQDQRITTAKHARMEWQRADD